MATSQWVQVTKKTLQKMIDAPMTVSAMAASLVKIYLSMGEPIPSEARFETTAEKKMETLLVTMMTKCVEFLDKQGETLPHDEFSMQVHRLTLSADRQKVAIYYSNGFAFPLEWGTDLEAKNLIEVVKR